MNDGKKHLLSPYPEVVEKIEDYKRENPFELLITLDGCSHQFKVRDFFMFKEQTNKCPLKDCGKIYRKRNYSSNTFNESVGQLDDHIEEGKLNTKYIEE